MRKTIEFIGIYSIRIVLRLLYIFPIKKNRLLFSAYEGKVYGCNPKYIFEALYSKLNTSCEFIWCINDDSLIPAEYNVKKVGFLSLRHIFYMMTSRVIVNNTGIEPIIPKRAGQVFINTWHGGGAYKKGQPNAKYKRQLRSKMTDYVISSCRAFSEEFSKESVLNIDKDRFLPIGMPRNDIFFSSDQYLSTRQKICALYNININDFIVLYAPTYRGYHHARHISESYIINDFNKIADAVKQRFGKKPIFLYRYHLGTCFSIEDALDVTAYQDMQELLLISDMLITDYSSSIWDFSLTHKPGFIYAPDVEEYTFKINFHTPIQKWQYPYAVTMEELVDNILNYNSTKAAEKIKAHHELLGSYEQGRATKYIGEIIESLL